MKRVAQSLFFWMMTVVLTVGVFLAALFTVILFFPFDSKRKICHAQGFWWADALFALNPSWDFGVSGMENVDKDKAYVITANHQSLGDIALLYKTHLQFKWVAKTSLFKIPIFGWCMSLMKYIRLERGEFSSIKDVYNEAGEWLRKDVSVLFFPEGTRSLTDEMNPFKNGAFKLAIKEQKPILPIYVEGTRDIIPKGSWIFRADVKCRLTVLPAIETTSYKPEDFALLRDTVRQRLILAAKSAKQ